MGKKSGNINPTDQARKEARKRELKKNKKQRQLVRQNVLKNKDPKNILIELETLDKMEYNPTSEPPYSIKVIQEKRKKLRETWNRVFYMYERDDPKLASELKGLEIDYERKRSQLVAQYESIKQAEKVNIDEIPLPDASMPLLVPLNDIRLPNTPAKSILKSPQVLNKKPPGPPPGPPPPLTEFGDDDDEDDEAIEEQNRKKIRFSDENVEKIVQSHYPPAPPPPMPTGFNAYGTPLMNFTPLTTRYPPGPPPHAATLNTVPPPLSHIAPQAQQSLKQPAHKLYNQLQSKVTEEKSKASSTIVAKPVLRNKIAEITKFVPTSLMVKRDSKPKLTQHREDPLSLYSNSNLPAYVPAREQQVNSKPSSDVAYESFMKEINKLL